MKRTLIAVVLLVWMCILPTPSWAQQFQNKAEYDAYMALYNEQDPAAKISLGEAFVKDFSDSEAAPIAYQLLVATHYSERAWRDLIQVAKQFTRAFPNATPETKSFIYTRAMAAAQQEQQPLDILEFGNEVLDLDRNNLGAMLTLPPVILDNLPAFGSARETNLARAFDLANRARVRAQQAYPLAVTDPQQAQERVQVFSRIYLYLGQVHEMRGDDQRAAAEYARILDYDPRSSDAYLRLGLTYQRQAAAQSVLLGEAIDSAGPVLTEDQTPQGGQNGADVDSEKPEARPLLDPESEALQEAVTQNLELAIDYLANAAALGGQAADLARTELTRIYDSRDPEQWGTACETRPEGFVCQTTLENASIDINRLISQKRSAFTSAAQ